MNILYQGKERIFDDLQTTYRIEWQGIEFSIYYTILGAFDKDDTIGIGYGAEIEINELTDHDTELFDSIIDLLSDIDAEREIDSYWDSCKSLRFTDYSSPDNSYMILQRALQAVTFAIIKRAFNNIKSEVVA